jgi:molybdate transport system substrate-binding protein
MKKLIFTLLLLTFSFAQIRVATAGNVSFAIKDLAKYFYKQTHIKVVPIIGSSGKLTAQIEHNAPYDVFLSANMKYPEYLYKEKIAKTKPKVYARGKLVLFAKNGIKNFNEIFRAKQIAIANPQTAPYGKATVEYLKNRHIYDKLKYKFIIGSNISTTFSYAVMVTNYGFVARSLLFKFPKLNNKNHFIDLDEKLYSPIKQGVVLISNKSEAKQFYQFLFSKEAKEIFLKYGYNIN